jgi:hypothetical protein
VSKGRFLRQVAVTLDSSCERQFVRNPDQLVSKGGSKMSPSSKGKIPGISSAALWLAIGVMVPQLISQNTTGRITGEVFDPSRAAMADVNVTALQLATGHSFKATSDSSGLYTFPNLPIGGYRITAEHTGFSKQVFDSVTVTVGESVRIDVNMVIGQVDQAVQVTSEAPVLEMSGATVGGTMQNQQISELPINGRDYARFSLLTPGAVLRSSEIADLTFNGLQSGNNQFSMDGIDATRVDEAYMSNGSERGARLLTGSLDTISEFKVQSGDYSAEYGRASGAYINIVNKIRHQQLSWHGVRVPPQRRFRRAQLFPAARHSRAHTIQ